MVTLQDEVKKMNDRAIPSERVDRAHPITPRGPEWGAIRDAVREPRFAEVRIINQDGVIGQIERLEKQRFR